METTYELEVVGMGRQKKRQPTVGAINEESGTSLQIVPLGPSPRRIDNGNSLKFPANPTTE